MGSKHLDSEEFIKQFYIPNYILEPSERKVEPLPFKPECPVLVFIDSKSGGQLGGDLLITYRSILNPKQVKSKGFWENFRRNRRVVGTWKCLDHQQKRPFCSGQ